jgi:predicted nucleic acid-binding protein
MTNGLYLIDTSIWIWALRPNGILAIRTRVGEILAERRGATTPMVLLELLGGAPNEKDYRELSEDLAALEQLPVSETTWEHSTKTAFDLRRRGITAPATDILIATVARDNAATLVHADRHFDLIAAQINLAVESWVSAIPAPKKRKR